MCRTCESKFSACLISSRSFQLCALTSIPRASSVALTEASVCPIEQMPQIRLRDPGDLGVVATTHHGLEEARGLRHLPLALLDHAVGDVDDDVAVALDAGQVLDADTSSRWS